MKRQHIPQLGPYKTDGVALKSVFTYGAFEDNIRNAPVRSTLHRHEFHEVAVFTEGEGAYMADFEDHPISAPCAVLIPAGVAHQWPNSLSLKGHIIAFDLDFLAAEGRNSGPASILRPPVPVVIPLADDELKSLMYFIGEIAKEDACACPHSRDAIRALLSLVLISLRRLHDNVYDSNGSELTSMDSLYSLFLDQLEQHWRTMRKPKDLAAAMRVSPDHLAVTLRKACGKNTSELIQERVLLEAKRMLCHSRMSVSEVAYDLGYEDPSYFTRFFKKHVGDTPKGFREMYQ